uniref:Uncharacterized protein n=1 Tax=Arundo donax TaxID=35708 RepID=A0A0A9EF95_ARUDO
MKQRNNNKAKKKRSYRSETLRNMELDWEPLLAAIPNSSILINK